MKKHTARYLVVLGIFLAGWSSAIAAEGFDPALPRDRAAIDRLNERHLSMVRAAVRACKPIPLPADTNPGGACIGSSVEQSVAESGDPGLKAFNARLPNRLRYDENRTKLDIDRVFGRTE